MPHRDGTMTLQERRVAQFHDITPTEIDALWHRVRHWIYNWGLARLAFDHALEKSFKVYDGSTPIVNYITKVANNWVLDEQRRHAREESLEVLRESDEDLDCLGAIDDEILPEEADGLDASFLAAVDQMLQGAVHAPGISPLEKWTAAHASLAFRELRYSVLQDEGIGINEYEDPEEIRVAEGHARHEPRQLINEHLAATLSAKTGRTIGVKTVQAAMTYLRRVVTVAQEMVHDEPIWK